MLKGSLFTGALATSMTDITLNSFPANCVSADTFANSLDPDKARQNVGPNLDPNYLTLR